MHGIKQAPPTVRLKTLPYPPNQTPPPGGQVQSKLPAVGETPHGLEPSYPTHKVGFTT